jgi:hypothetical protein
VIPDYRFLSRSEYGVWVGMRVFRLHPRSVIGLLLVDEADVVVVGVREGGHVVEQQEEEEHSQQQSVNTAVPIQPPQQPHASLKQHDGDEWQKLFIFTVHG